MTLRDPVGAESECDSSQAATQPATHAWPKLGAEAQAKRWHLQSARMRRRRFPDTRGSPTTTTAFATTGRFRGSITVKVKLQLPTNPASICTAIDPSGFSALMVQPGDDGVLLETCTVKPAGAIAPCRTPGAGMLSVRPE